MKIRLFLVCATFHFFSTVYALEIDIQAFSYFAGKTYAEVNIRVDGGSVTHVADQGLSKASVEFLLIVYQSDSTAVYMDKFILQGEQTEKAKDFLAVKRFYIKQGIYRIYIKAVDVHEVNNVLEMEQELRVMPDWNGVMGLSDPVIVRDKIPMQEGMDPLMERNGYLVEPLAYGYADSTQNTVYFVQEIYLPFADSQKTYFLNYVLSDKYRNDLQSKVLLSQYKKLESSELQFVVIPLSLKELASGAYHLSTYLQDAQKKKYDSKKVNFFKSNPRADLMLLEIAAEETSRFAAKIKDEDLDYILKAHVPITDNIMLPTLQSLMKSDNFSRKRKFIEQYWTRRSPGAPGDAFDKYMEVARAVDKEYYSNTGYGFQTHRGHIFLKHGKPSNVLSIDNEPDAPPYEIWYYHKTPTTNQTNVRFLFWNESLAHNDFWLLHSNCYGERNNPSWETQLYKSMPQDKLDNTVDGTEVKPGLNRNAKLYFNQF